MRLNPFNEKNFLLKGGKSRQSLLDDLVNITTLVEDKFKRTQTLVRHLSENNPAGILACGYVIKNTKQGAHYDMVMNHYGGVLVLSGEGEYIDETFKRIPLKAGSFIQRFPYHKHTTTVTSEDWTELFICMGSTLFENLKEINVLTTDKPILTTGLDYTLIERLLSFYDRLELANNLELPLLVSEAIAIFSRAAYLDKKNARSSEGMDQLILACQYIEEKISSRLSVEDVAKHVDLGYEKFRKIFTQHYGIAPGLFIIQQRINLAQKRLTDHDLTITEIAAELGYTDAYAFSKQFKKITGMTPSDFKKVYIYGN